MKVRLHGSLDQLSAAIKALKLAFELREVSRTYADRPPSALHRVYVNAEPRRPADPERGEGRDAYEAAWAVARAAAERAGFEFACRCGRAGRHRVSEQCGTELRRIGAQPDDRVQREPFAVAAAALDHTEHPPPPRVEIEKHKATRDLLGELDAIRGHHAALEAQPWWPPQVGDVAIAHPPAGSVAAAGETFVADDHPGLGLRFRSVSRPEGFDHTPDDGYAIEDLWFEWPAISIVRAGVIHPPHHTRGMPQ